MEVLACHSFLVKAFLLVMFPVHFSFADPSCNATERELLSNAFANVSGFNISLLMSNSSARNENRCSPGALLPPPPLKEIRLPSRNLRGTVSWMLLRNISSLQVLDLSGNALRGSVPAGFWSAPGLVQVDLSSNQLGGPVGYEPEARRPPSSSLLTLNLSSNRFTNTVLLSGFPRLTVLNLSRNDLRSLPSGIGELAELDHLDISGCNISGDIKPLTRLRSLRYLDASRNRMSGSFPVDFPPMAGLEFLNISFNNFTGRVAPEQLQRFGVSAFANAGDSLRFEKATAPSSSLFPQKRRKEEKRSRKRPSRAVVWGLASSAALSSVLAIAVLAACIRRRRRRTMGMTKKEKKWTGMMTAPASRRAGERSSGKEVLDMEAAAPAAPWVAELIAAGSAVAGAPVVMFEKPLIQLTFSELAGATSGFGVESQLAEGRRSGPVYRAVLPGGIDVVIKVLEKAKAVEAAEARAAFQELGRLKHPNILPLLGYCIAGREKLLLYEYMDNGDLHRWLHELPTGRTNVEDWSTDTWDHPGEASRGGASAAAPFHAHESTAMGWGTRHRIALGVARGLAFLHHAGSRPVVHGHLVASNVLLDDEFEPRVADFGTGDADGSTEEDVYCYGLVLMELLTGRVGSPETVAWVRPLVRGREAARCLDPRLRRHGGGLSESEEERAETEMVEGLRVAFLCTAESPEKRPTMRQVVGLLKDVRPCSLTG